MKLGRRSGSAALVGDGRHLISDAITSVGAIAALVAVRMTGLVWIDPLVAILMACILVGLGIRMVRRSLGELVDEQDAGDYETVRRLLGHKSIRTTTLFYTGLEHRDVNSLAITTP